MKNLTDKQRSVLSMIASSKTAVQAFLIYPVISPQGRYLERDRGPTRGGPSGREVAVHFYLGKQPMCELVHRELVRDKEGVAVAFGGYVLTTEGRRVVSSLARHV